MQRHNRALAVSSVLFVSACGSGDLGTGADATPAASIVGIVWKLTNVSTLGEGTAGPPRGIFTLELRESGEVHLVADCNTCNGRYTLGERSFAVEGGVLACTRALCPSAPFDTEYVALVTLMQSWEGDTSSLTLFGDRSQLRFQSAPP